MGLSSFERRILVALGIFLGVQVVGFAVFGLFFTFPDPWNWLFFPIATAYHGVLWWALWSVRSHFLDLEGQPLERIGIPNLLTLFRLTSLPFITLMFLLARSVAGLAVPLVVFISVAFLTDLLDGFLARSLKMGTQLGKLLDSSTDYIILFSLTLVLGVTGVLDAYLIVAILVRLGFQMGGVLWFQWRYQRQYVETTWLGKASLFVLMVLYAVEILVFLKLPGLEDSWAVVGFEVLVALAMVVSTVDKAVFFLKKIQQDKLDQQSANPQ